MVAVRSGRGVQDSSPEQLAGVDRSEEHTSELQSQSNIVCRLLLEKKKNRFVPVALRVMIMMRLSAQLCVALTSLGSGQRPTVLVRSAALWTMGLADSPDDLLIVAA